MINERKLSALQLESIVYASQQHNHFLPDGNRAGFLIGDGAGVGKGRTIAGLIFENYLKADMHAMLSVLQYNKVALLAPSLYFINRSLITCWFYCSTLSNIAYMSV